MLSDAKKKSQIIMEELQKRSRKCHDFVRKSFLSERIEHLELQEALKHYFSYWNDFTHPGLFSIACQAVGGQSSRTVQAQAALAMIAAAFDIHDDIIDRSQTKHGYPTVYGKFGQDISLLLGNAFMTNGFTLIGTSVSTLSDRRIRKIFAVTKESLFEVGNAHALELSFKGKVNVSPAAYMRILEMKAASIEADMHIAAIIGGGTRNECQTMEKYGRTLGILATLREEFVDVFELEELNQRLHSETLPIPVLYALQDKETREEIEKILNKQQLTAKDVNKLVDQVFNSEPVAGLMKKMRTLMGQAIDIAYQLENEKSTALLVEIVQSMLEDL